MLPEPYKRFLYIPEARDDFIWTAVGTPRGLFALWLAVINLAAFLVFGLDKWKAGRREKRPSTRRVPERTLFLLAALGGSAGALLGMRVWRHKTLRRSFRFGIPAILALQIAAAVGFRLWWSALR